METISTVLRKNLDLKLITKSFVAGFVKNIHLQIFIFSSDLYRVFYEYLQECGFILIFKQTISVSGSIKGNCDAELVLKTVSDFYTKAFDSCILITGDGDFGCLAEFLKDNNAINRIIAPDENKCIYPLVVNYMFEKINHLYV